MTSRRARFSPYLSHAARVALIASAVIGLVYVITVVVFDVVDGHRTVAEVDSRLNERLGDGARHPAHSAMENTYDNAHDADESPVFLWRLGATPGQRLLALTPGAPPLRSSGWSPSTSSVTTQVGTTSIRLRGRRVAGGWLIAGQSLAETNHIATDLATVEIIAGPLLLVTVFLGTLLIGLKASGPVESARRRQLEFAADASHELRTPLSVIEAEVGLSLSTERTSDEYRATLERVGTESQRLRDIVEDLLWLSRFDSQPPPPSDEPVDVSAVAVVCADRFGAVAVNRDISLSVQQRGEGQPWINAPPEWVDRLTTVLVDNACRYAGRGGAVQLHTAADGHRVRLVVEDSGPGIDPAERSRLFDRFHRATDQGSGAGLGLAIADAVVRATGGEWRVGDSDLGGARMEVVWHRSPGARDLAHGEGRRTGADATASSEDSTTGGSRSRVEPVDASVQEDRSGHQSTLRH